MQYFGFDRPSFGIKTFGFGANFDPMTLFAGGKQGVWYDPSDKSTLFQDVAGTVPVTKDGDPVALMRDKSGNGNHATQTLSTRRPIYKTDGILHWLDFDGVDDWLKFPNAAIRVADTAHYMGAAASTNNVSSGQYIAGGTGDSGLLLLFAASVSKLNCFGNSRTSLNLVYSSITEANKKYVLSLTTDIISKKYICRENGVIVADSTIETAVLRDPANYAIGARGGAPFGDIKFYGMIVISGAESLLADDITQADNYLATKSGVTL